MVLNKGQLKELYSKETEIVNIHNNVEYTIISHFEKGSPWETPKFSSIGIESKAYVSPEGAPF